MSEHSTCPVCSKAIEPNKNNISQCFSDYKTHYYHISFRPESYLYECIREFVIGFDIWSYPNEQKFSYNIGSEPWCHIIDDKLTIMELYNRIYKMKTYL